MADAFALPVGEFFARLRAIDRMDDPEPARAEMEEGLARLEGVTPARRWSGFQ